MTAAGRCAAQTPKEAASPPLTVTMGLPRSRPGDAPRKDTGPPLSVQAGCDRGATANRRAAWHMDTPSRALSAEPPAAPGPGKAGRPSLPRPAARRVRCLVRQVTSERPDNEVNGCSIIRRNSEITRIRYEEVSTV